MRTITLLTAVTICFAEPLVMINFRWMPSMENVIPESGSIYNTMARSGDKCGIKCSSVEGLKSFFYVQDSGVCQCHDVTYTVDVISLPSARYFEKQATSVYTFSCSLDDNTFHHVVLSDGHQFNYRAFFDRERTFAEADTKCKQEGAVLLEVLTLEKFNFSMELMACHGYESKSFWISGGQNSTTLGWETPGGVALPMGEPFWGKDRPNSGGTDRCVWMYADIDHRWDDRGCDGSGNTYAICEMP